MPTRVIHEHHFALLTSLGLFLAAIALKWVFCEIDRLYRS